MHLRAGAPVRLGLLIEAGFQLGQALVELVIARAGEQDGQDVGEPARDRRVDVAASGTWWYSLASARRAPLIVRSARAGGGTAIIS